MDRARAAIVAQLMTPNPFAVGVIWGRDSVTISGGAKITGPVSSNGQVTVSGSTTQVTGKVTSNDSLQFKQMDCPASYTPVFSGSKGVTYEDGSTTKKTKLAAGTLLVASGANLTLSPGTYYFSDLVLAGNGSLTTQGKVTIIIGDTLNTSGGYIVDDWSGIHPLAEGAGNLPPQTWGGPYWPGQDVVRGIALLANGTGGYVVDDWGGIHSFAVNGGSLPSQATGGPYWPSQDAVRGIAPDRIVDNPRKVGFNAPIGDLLDTKDAATRAYLLDKSPIFEHLRRDRIEALIDKAHLPNSESKFLFYFLTTKLFLEEFSPQRALA